MPDDIDKMIKDISSIEHLDKSTVVRRLLSKAAQDWQIDHVLEQYKDGKITIGRAAQMAGVPLREMIAIAAKKGIPFQYSLDDLKEDFQAARVYDSQQLNCAYLPCKDREAQIEGGRMMIKE